MRKIQKILTSAGGVFYLSCCCLSGQGVYSGNIVGYINQPIFAGYNFVANQLSNSNNTLNVLFQTDIPEGATFTEWDSSQLGYLPVSTYDTTTGWSINYELTYGQGGLFYSPTTFTNLFLGSVWPGYDVVFNPPLISGSGVFLLSCYIPIAATFQDVVGRDPQEGDSVEILNALTQTETITTFHDDAWNNGAPILDVGESALFGLGSDIPLAPVPEPSVWALLAAGMVWMMTRSPAPWPRLPISSSSSFSGTKWREENGFP